MKIKLLVEGADMKPGPTVGQKLGPLGINIGKVIEQVNSATKEFKGIKVPVELDIDGKTKEFKVNVSSPPTSELLKKELGIEKGSGLSGKEIVGNASIEQIISVAKSKQANLLSDTLEKAVKSVIGSSVSLGILIENKEPKEILEEISEGKYETEIKEGKTETDKSKKDKLEKFLQKRLATQEERKRLEEEEAKKAEEEKEAKEGEEPEEGKEESEETKAEEKKEEEPKK